MIIVSDTTPISELAKVGYLDLLPQLFGKVVIPQGVFNFPGGKSRALHPP
ncbi:MAG: hypothetical protein F6K40_25950 [Okeania sp. SIO3I5]|nr:hypothetical protein [Okeania sp. SIO3I5]NEQ39516.1 hypothetical protein [Okeania sp. SIO3I5]